jgi:hypothetical protein
LNIKWVKINPGRVFIGSNNRSILFGGIGPRHEINIDYEFEISKYPVKISESRELLLSEEFSVSSESEWALAFKQNKIEGNNEIEKMSDKIRNSYWNKYCDGRAMIEDEWLINIGRKWDSGRLTSIEIGNQDNSASHYRIVRKEIKVDYGPKSPKLPAYSSKKKIIFEEFVIALIIGIIPSFTWAYFNAKSGYISEGWLNLVFGGLFIGFFTILFWRPKTNSWVINENGSMTEKN